ncbi:MAG: DUF1565 domain-containing protein [Acidobacteria bacterium]|nr:DUF1565 domain-containing protein [Acidobacteriota bacterium]
MLAALLDADGRYVSRSGSDTNNGSSNAPWRTIQHALDRVRPGETIYVRGGVYHEQLTFKRSGTPDAAITLAGFPGESVTLDGAGLNRKSCLSLESFDDITVRNLNIRDFYGDGVRGFGIVGWGATDRITLRDINLSLVGTPIKFAADGVSKVSSGIVIENITARDYTGGGIDLGPGLVEDVVIRRVQLYGVTSGNDTASDAVAVEHGSRVLVEDALIRGHMGDGVDLKADNATVRRADVRDFGRNGLKLWGANVTVDGCWVSGSRAGLGALILPGAGPFVVRNSVILGGGGESGTASSYTVELGRYGAAATEPIARATLYGNTFHADKNQGVLIYVAPNVRLDAASDYNTYYSPRAEALLGANNSAGKNMYPVSAADINSGAWARFIGAERHSRFNPNIAASPPATSTPNGAPGTRPATSPAVRPRRIGSP